VPCQADGNYEERKGCLPVECGATKVPEHAIQASGNAELVFDDKATFSCNAGYSTDGTMKGPTMTGTRCQATGKLTATLQCLNMDDCEGNKCGAHGECSDNKNPTGAQGRLQVHL
jgi:hypothetical protein